MKFHTLQNKYAGWYIEQRSGSKFTARKLSSGLLLIAKTPDELDMKIKTGKIKQGKA